MLNNINIYIYLMEKVIIDIYVELTFMGKLMIAYFMHFSLWLNKFIHIIVKLNLHLYFNLLI